MKPARAAKRDFILIGRPDPATGPLSAFSEPTPWVDNRAIHAINKNGGIYIKEAGKKLPIKIKIMDTESDPTKASELAAKLILQDKVDIMMPMHTPVVVNPVTAICERYKMPCIGMDDPIEAWLTGGPYKWSFVVYSTVESIIDSYITVWDEYADRTTKVVGGLWPNDPDGVMFSQLFHRKLPPKGYKIVDPGRFPFGINDWTSQINMFKQQKADIITGVLIGPDWASFWRQCHQQGYIPKIASSARAFIFPSEPAALGSDLAEGVNIGCAWSPFHQFKSSLTGESAKELCDAWTNKFNKYWTQDMGFKYAGYEIAADVLKR
ncbi:MAG: ABC transporter substrate-binding protein, partial [Deltaproteobacteria bacterium]|nr:ABC transporter substrate-binding protein [Deltaproteobacteria bacterium]